MKPFNCPIVLFLKGWAFSRFFFGDHPPSAIHMSCSTWRREVGNKVMFGDDLRFLVAFICLLLLNSVIETCRLLGETRLWNDLWKSSWNNAYLGIIDQRTSFKRNKHKPMIWTSLSASIHISSLRLKACIIYKHEKLGPIWYCIFPATTLPHVWRRRLLKYRLLPSAVPSLWDCSEAFELLRPLLQEEDPSRRARQATTSDIPAIPNSSTREDMSEYQFQWGLAQGIPRSLGRLLLQDVQGLADQVASRQKPQQPGAAVVGSRYWRWVLACCVKL